MDLEYIRNDLVLYSRTGKIKPLVECIRNVGGDVNFKWGDGTPLYHAANCGKYGVLKMLLSHGADVSAIGSSGRSVLIAAAIGEDVDCITALLEAGANPNHRDMDGRTALDYAVSSGSPMLVEVLTKVTKNPWSDAKVEGLQSFDSSLAADALRFVKRAISAGRSGDVQVVPKNCPLPHWFRILLGSIPLAGIAASLRWKGDSYIHDCIFLGAEQLADIEQNQSHDTAAFLAHGVWPIAEGSDACYWVIELDGSPTSPVFFWNHSAVEATRAFKSFSSFLKALKVTGKMP